MEYYRKSGVNTSHYRPHNPLSHMDSSSLFYTPHNSLTLSDNGFGGLGKWLQVSGAI